VVAGPNGSGKTSFTEFLKSRSYDFGYYVNPDDIAAELVGTYEDRVRRAQVLADERRKQAIADDRSFSFETVFSHPSKLDELDAARKAGFEITLFFIGVDDPSINIERVRTRVMLGGHAVPEDRILPRYLRTMNLLIEMVQRVDHAVIFDNSVQSNDRTAFYGRVVAECRSDGTRITVNSRFLVPAWTLRYLVEPAGLRGWQIIRTLPLGAITRPKLMLASVPSDEGYEHFAVRDGVRCAGAHLIVDLHGAKRLDDIDHVEATLRRCVQASKAKLLHIHLHHFQPSGISGVAVLDASHISIHTWPEVGYAALDIFMSAPADPDACIPVLREAFAAKRVGVNELLRGQDT